MNKIYIASDHAGYELKQEILKAHTDFIDLGPNTADRVDYPDYADLVANKLKKDSSARGILVCGSGQGMALRANKFNHIRAALCWTPKVAKFSREHNDANVLCLGSRVMELNLISQIIKDFFSTDFAGGRHTDRVKKISKQI